MTADTQLRHLINTVPEAQITAAYIAMTRSNDYQPIDLIGEDLWDALTHELATRRVAELCRARLGI